MDWIDLGQLTLEDMKLIGLATILWLLVCYGLMILVGHNLPWLE